MDIDSLDDFICNIKELMKSYFYPKEDVDDLIEDLSQAFTSIGL